MPYFAIRPDLLTNFEAVDTRQHYIEQNKIGLQCPKQGYGIFAASGFLDPKSCFFEAISGQKSLSVFVFDDEDQGT